MEKPWEELTEEEKNAKAQELLRGYKEAQNAPISEEGIRRWKEILAEHEKRQSVIDITAMG